VYRH